MAGTVSKKGCCKFPIWGDLAKTRGCWKTAMLVVKRWCLSIVDSSWGPFSKFVQSETNEERRTNYCHVRVKVRMYQYYRLDSRFLPPIFYFLRSFFTVVVGLVYTWVVSGRPALEVIVRDRRSIFPRFHPQSGQAFPRLGMYCVSVRVGKFMAP